MASIYIIDKAETYPSTPGDLAVIYNDFEEIVADAETIVYISVKNQTVELLNGLPQTHTFVNVQEVYKGNVTRGDVLEVIEEGGSMCIRLHNKIVETYN